VLGDLQQITRNAATYDAQPSISSSGKKLVFVSNRSGNRDVWIKDLESGGEVALTNTTVLEGYPRISGEGSKVVYRVIEDPKQAFYVLSSSGGAPEKICEDCGLPMHWSSDGQRILYEPGSRIARLVLFNVASKQKIELLQQPQYGLHAGRFSPDDRWIAYHADNGPFTRQIFIAPFHGETAPDEKAWIPVTDGATVDHSPYWSPDGSLLYFLSERDGFRCIWAQRLRPGTKRPIGPVLPIQHFHTARHTLLMNVVASPWEVGLSVIRDKMVFSLDDLAGNIWMAKLEGQK
jgi:Tol biopolymer transport system component